MRFVALPLLAAQLTTDARQIAAVAFAEQVPLFLLGLVSGVVGDRFDRRRIMWTVDAARTVVVGGLVVAVAADAVSIPLLVAVALLLGAGQTLYNGGWSGMVPALVGREGLTRANARLQSSSLIIDTLLGTPLGAVLFGIAAVLPFIVDTASFAVAAALVFLLRGEFRPRARTAPNTLATVRRDTAEGIRWLWRHQMLRRLCLVSAVTNLVEIGLVAILVLYARRTLGLSSLGFALLIAAFAVGGVVGAAWTTRLTARLGAPTVIRLATLGTAVAAAGAGVATWGPVAGVCLAAYGAANLVWAVSAVSLRQSLVPTELLSRVTMAYQMVKGGAGALGAVVAGLVAHDFGLRAPFLGGAVLLAAATLLRVRSAEGEQAAKPGQDPTPDPIPGPASTPAAGTGAAPDLQVAPHLHD